MDYYVCFDYNCWHEIFTNVEECNKFVNDTFCGCHKFSLKSDAENWIKKRMIFQQWQIDKVWKKDENIPPPSFYKIEEINGIELVNFINNFLSPIRHQCGQMLDMKLYWCGENYCITERQR